MATPVRFPGPRRHRGDGNTVDLLTQLLINGPPDSASGAREMLDQVRRGLKASAAALWAITDGRARRVLLVDDAESSEADASVVDDVSIVLDRLQRNHSVRCRSGQTAGLEVLVPEGVRSFIAAAAGDAGGTIEGALILGWTTITAPAPPGVEPLLRIAAAQLLALRPAIGQPAGMPPAVIDSLASSVLIVDRSGAAIAANAAWAEWGALVGVRPGETSVDFLAACRIASARGDEDAAIVVAGIEAVCAGTIDRFEHTCRWEHLGQRRYILIRVTQLRRPERGAVIVLEDMTMERIEDIVPGMAEERFERFADSIPAPIWMLAPDGRLLYGNQAWRDATGGGTSKRPWTEAVHDDDVAVVAPVLRSAAERRTGFHIELRLRGEDGGFRWWSFVGVPRFGPQGTLDSYIGTCSDSTARRHAQQNLRELGGRLLAAQEAQRGRIARELHDDIGQQLALLASRLNLAAKPDGQTREQMRASLDWALGAVRELATSIHNLSYSLYPAKLRLLGLDQTLQALCRDVAAAAHVTVTFAGGATGLPDLPENIALCVFRVAQEALQNAVKHSGADRIEVSLATSNARQVTLTVADRGRGFDPLDANGAALGLLTMRERVELSGGQLRIDTAPGRGTTIEAVIPIPRTRVP